MTHAIVPVSVSKYPAIVGRATFTMDPSIPSITTPRASAQSRSFWRNGSVIMEVTRIPFGAGDFINWKGSAYGVPFHLDDSGSAYCYPQMALLGSANRDHFFKIIHDKKICSSKSCTGSPISYPNFFILRTTISSSL